MERCEKCGRGACEIAYSHSAAAHVCLDCHCQAAPPMSKAARDYKPPAGPKPLKPSAYTRMVYRVWDRLADAGPVFYLERDLIAGRCPVCLLGSVGVRFIKTDPPELDIEGCTEGCTDVQVAGALR